MIRAKAPKFTAEDKAFLAAVRDDVVARPGVYRAGVDYLVHHYSQDALYEVDLAVWERRREIDSYWPEPERDDPSRAWLCQRLIRAFGGLLEEGIETADDDLEAYDTTRAAAVLCLTWLLTDKKADEQPLGAEFGAWGRDFVQQMKIKGRAVARVATIDELNMECRGRWMALARQAWEVMGSQRDDGSTISEKAAETRGKAPVRRGRRRKTSGTRPLTARQQQAVELCAKHSGKISAVAIEMGIGHSTVIQHLKAAHQKLPELAPKKTGPAGRTRRLPTDRRGQAVVTDADGEQDEDGDLE